VASTPKKRNAKTGRGGVKLSGKPPRAKRQTKAKAGSKVMASGAMPLASSPRHPWSVPYEIIKNFSDARLTEVMSQLLVAEAVLRSADLSQVSVNSEEKAPDAGCDGWTPQPQVPSTWLGTRETCWQFKAGKAGEPSRLTGEIGKPKPKRTGPDPIPWTGWTATPSSSVS
jgi:hypothetical protein